MCYYRCFESITSDLNAIQDNCGLYNDPMSAVVQCANRVIPAIKKLLDVVVATHVREQREKLSAENEKKKLLASVVAPEVGLDDEKDAQKAQSKSVDPFRFPFKGQLYRDWLQSINPNVAKHQDTQTCRASLPQWIPQTGDSVLYSRELHVKFVEGHYDSLEINQLVVPHINACNGELPRLDNCTSGSSPEKEQGEATPPTNDLSSGWVTALIVNIRAEFPRTRKAPSTPDAGPESRFTTDAPILAVRLQIDGDGEGAAAVVYWRPCAFFGHDEGGEEQVTGCCPSCGNRFAASFLCPTWADQFGRRLHLEGLDLLPATVGNPPRIQDEESDAIVRSLDLLKRRCMEQVLPDHLDPNLTTDRVKQGYLPRVTKLGNRPLPTFDLGEGADLLPREVLTKVPREEISALLSANFLPPWLVLGDRTGSNASAVGSLEASVSPWPKMSLELVVSRLKNDFYRHKAAITSDIIEAYITSVCLCLAAAAKRKKNAISIKKMATVLSSRKYASSANEEVYPDKGRGKAGKKKKVPPSNAVAITTAPNANGRKQAASPMKPVKLAKVKLKTAAKSPKKKSSTKQHDSNGSQGKLTEEILEHGLVASKSRKFLNEEETAIVSRLEGVRRLYAAALTCVSEVTSVSYLFGIQTLTVSRQKLRQQMIVFSHEDVQAAQARKILMALLESLRKDACDNRYPLMPHSRPQVKVKFTVDGTPVERDIAVVIPALSVPAPSLSALEAPAPAAKKNSMLPVASVGSNIPESNATQSSGLQTASTSILLDAGDECGVARDSVSFRMGDYEGDLPLSRLFFGKEKRMSSCVRCQASKKSMVFCRGKVTLLTEVLCCVASDVYSDVYFDLIEVIRGHSNVDFDLRECLRDAGGVDGLLRTMLKEPMPTIEAITENAPRACHVTEMAHAADQAQSNGGNVASPDNSENQDPGCENRMEADKDGDEEGRDPISVNKKDQKEANETKDHYDARELYRKAQAYQTLAEELASSAKAYKDAPPQLSQEFMDETFPVDPSDGKYLLCVVCGLDGELICCEARGCPTVVHVKCTTMSAAPDGDWFCDECLLKRAENDEYGELPKKAALTNGSGDNNGSDRLVESNSSALVTSAKSISSQVTGAPASKEASKGEDSACPSDVLHEVELACAPVSSRDDTKVATHCLTMYPIVRYDESKHRELSAGLGHLFFMRTGHRRGLKSEDLGEGRKRKSQTRNEANEESAKDEELATENERDAIGTEGALGTIALGTVFYKKFKGHGTFEGKVKQLPTEEHPFYRVRYEDDDEEDITESQLLRLLHNRKPKKGASSVDNDHAPAKAHAQLAQQGTDVKKKRGRPRKLSLEDASGNKAFHAKPTPETSKAPGAGNAITKRDQSNMTGKHSTQDDRLESTGNGNANVGDGGMKRKPSMSAVKEVENHEASNEVEKKGSRSRKRSLEDTSSGNTAFNAKPAGNAPTKRRHSTMNGKHNDEEDRLESMANVSVEKDGSNPKSSMSDVEKDENHEASTPSGKRRRRQPDRFVDRFATSS
jgi:hypothetical protein